MRADLFESISGQPQPEVHPLSTSAPPNEKKRHTTISDLSRNLLLGLGDQSVALGLDTLRPTLTVSLVLGTLSVHLLLEDTLTLALSLGLLDLL